MNDPRSNPVPGAEIEVLGKNKSSRRVVRKAYSGAVTYMDLRKQVVATCTLAAWRKWAFNGRIVSRGQA